MSTIVPNGWSETDIDRETLLDVTVNLIPMGILAFFVLLFLVYAPFPPDMFIYVVSHALTIIPFVFLGLLTYVSAKIISRDEAKSHQRSEMAMGIDTEHAEPESEEPSPVEQAEREAVEGSDRERHDRPADRSADDDGRRRTDRTQAASRADSPERTDAEAGATTNEPRDET